LAIYSLITKGSFDPFVILGFFLIAFFEFFFRKQTRIPSIILSLICSLAVVFSLKKFVIDFKIMMRPLPEFGINTSARVFYQPALFNLKDGDKIIYQAENLRYFVGVFKGKTSSLAKIYLPHKNQTVDAPFSRIKGKIIYFTQKNKNQP
jgi:hypothetical protein